MSWRRYTGSKIKCSGRCRFSPVNEKQGVHRLIKIFLMLHIYRQRRYGKEGQVTLKPTVSVLFMAKSPPPPLTLGVIWKSTDASKPITMGGEANTILCPTNDPSNRNLTSFLTLTQYGSTVSQPSQLPTTVERKHQNPLTVMPTGVEHDPPGSVNDTAVPRRQRLSLFMGLSGVPV